MRCTTCGRKSDCSLTCLVVRRATCLCRHHGQLLCHRPRCRLPDDPHSGEQRSIMQLHLLDFGGPASCTSAKAARVLFACAQLLPRRGSTFLECEGLSIKSDLNKNTRQPNKQRLVLATTRVHAGVGDHRRAAQLGHCPPEHRARLILQEFGRGCCRSGSAAMHPLC